MIRISRHLLTSNLNVNWKSDIVSGVAPEIFIETANRMKAIIQVTSYYTCRGNKIVEQRSMEFKGIHRPI